MLLIGKTDGSHEIRRGDNKMSFEEDAENCTMCPVGLSDCV